MITVNYGAGGKGDEVHKMNWGTYLQMRDT